MFGRAASSKLLVRCVPRGGIATPRTVLRRYATEPPPSLEQMTSLLNSNPALARQLVKSVNADCSQQIVTAAITRVNPDYIFSRQDTNKDGMVSKEEFTRWYHNELGRGGPIGKPSLAVAATAASEAAADAPATNRQLAALGLLTAIPMVAFGFVDNFIMVVAGDAIDNSLGVTFGLSAMCAAGFGNTMSDVCGVFLSSSIEKVSGRLGLPDPKLSARQLKQGRVGMVMSLAGALGIAVGCMIGMFPLAFKAEKPEGHHPVQAVFKRMDSEGNGKITLADMKKMKLELGIDMADGSLERFVAKADTNHDGEMDLKEFTKLLSDWIHGRIKIDHTLMGGSKEEFDKYDLNHDGVLDAQEMALRAAAKAQTLDKNHDGVVTQAEFTINAAPADSPKA